jgi:23S rRNA (pseudouridine1915-N3)-methyltransferase
MRLTIMAVGKLRPYYREACDDYRRRLGRFATVDEVEIRAADQLPDVQQRIQESDRITERLPARAKVIALAREGSKWTSEAFAGRLDAWRGAGMPLAFVIGGSHGLAGNLLELATDTWSLGPLTLPHELARVVAYEQLYRGFTILNHMPYHKGGA